VSQFCHGNVKQLVENDEEGRPNGQECHIMGVVGSNVLHSAKGVIPVRGGISKIQACFKI